MFIENSNRFDRLGETGMEPVDQWYHQDLSAPTYTIGSFGVQTPAIPVSIFDKETGANWWMISFTAGSFVHSIIPPPCLE